MKNKKLKSVLVTAVLSAAMLVTSLTGCGSSTAQSDQNTSTKETEASDQASAESGESEASGKVMGGDLVLGTSDTLGEFFSPYIQGVLSGYGWPCYQPLAYYRADGTYEGCLASSWERNDDDNSLTLYLVENACFSDGTPFTAEDVVFSLASRKDYGTDSTIGSPISVEALDDYTVKITWSEFSLNYESWILTQFMFSKKAFDENGLDWMLNNMLGTGPYKLVEFIPDVSVYYERNENYWGEGEAAPDSIKFLYYSDSTTMLAAFLGNEIASIMTADATTADQIIAAGYEAVTLSGSADCQYHAVPLSIDENDPLYNVEVRKAIFEYGIDWDTFAAGLGGSVGYHTDAIGMTLMSYYDESLEKSSYDPELAMQMLADAGYPDGFSTTIYTAAPFSAAATVLQAELKKLNIEAECEFVDYTLVTSEYMSGKATQNGICLTATYFPDSPQIDRFTKHMNPTATYGPACTWSDEIMELWENAKSAKTQEEEDAALLAYVDKYVHDESNYWPLYNTRTLVFNQEWYQKSPKAQVGSLTDPMEIWIAK